ncbi:MAG: response regulator [Candidatus Kapabacteria bacterium]|nr:response regulator [Candidatus Kapabacteria bacterium]
MKKKIIFCIDDEKIVLDSLKSDIKEFLGNDYIIEITESGAEALEIFHSLLERNYEIPLVICDYLMPVMKGDDVLREIKLISPGSYCIMLTGMATLAGVINAINKAGLYRFIGKPWESGDLNLTINEALLSYQKDIALEKRRIELEEANAKLLKLDSAKNYFLGLLSHELNTPLIGINGNAKLIAQLTDDQEIIECTDSILTSEAKLRKFAELSLLITRIQTDKYHSTFEDESLKEIVESSIYSAQHKLLAKNINIINNFPETDFLISADSNLITKVFYFVIDNSIKYSSNNKQILISTILKDNSLILNIQDQGTGFSEKTLENIFQFFESTDDLMAHSEGTGLSLAAAKVIMEMHNFEIKAFNADEGGAIVQLVFYKSLTHL